MPLSFPDYGKLAHTLNNSQQNDNYEEEERNIEHNTINLVIVTIRFTDLVTYATTSSYSFIKMEDETLVKEIRI